MYLGSTVAITSIVAQLEQLNLSTGMIHYDIHLLR